ncbi:MAG: polyribonucleotide nucleotidyltransferase [Patescibacteria group bacterium]
MLETKEWSIDWAGRKLTIETGRFALQALSSCTVRYGDTMILATVVKSKEVRDGIDYFPLMVDFEEKLYAAGKIKGSRFIKREGRPSDEAILVSRLIDRAIRPLFDERVRNDVQVILTALSVDGENDAAITALIAASCVVATSSIPWEGPIAAARIGRKDGQLILNATINEIKTGDLDLIVAGTPEKLVMTEAGANEVAEDEMYEAMKWGCAELQPVVELIKKIQKDLGVKKNDPADEVVSEAVAAVRRAKELAEKFIIEHSEEMIFDAPKITRQERYGTLDKIEKALKVFFADNAVDEDAVKPALKEIKTIVQKEVTKRILNKSERLDHRQMEEIRELQVAIDPLPNRVHGSAMFMRGDTQVLSAVTLGAPGDVQTLDSMEEDGTKRYMHHYNDTPASYGETGPLRGPGRRAIGHGALAERALEPVLPPQEKFPYAIRVVSEVMGSNGSSSMASTCGSTLSLMAAGVPLKKPVAGIAMGLASDNKGRWQVITDLQDVEDGPGGMDFKIAGTNDGITAIQMDTKTFGLSWEIVKQTIAQSYKARLQILAKMATAIAAPRSDLSPFAPRIETILIDPEKIRDVIGPGGKIINKIIDETGVQIDIEQDGRVMVTSKDGEGMKKAIKTILELTKEVQAGEIYEGTVVRLEDFGAFVQILPNKDGLVHVSEISWERVGRPADVLKINDKVQVKVREIDNLGRVNLSMKELKPKPDGYVDQPPRERRPMGGGGGHGGGRGGFRN